MRLMELSAAYTSSAAALKSRIVELERQCQAGDDLLLDGRIRTLQAMLREARELAVLTQRYYERGYRRNGKYTL